MTGPGPFNLIEAQPNPPKKVRCYEFYHRPKLRRDIYWRRWTLGLIFGETALTVHLGPLGFQWRWR